MNFWKKIYSVCMGTSAEDKKSEVKKEEEIIIDYTDAAKTEEGKAVYQQALEYARTSQEEGYDSAKMFEMVKKAALLGNTAAQERLWHCYRYGAGTEENKSLAMKWLMESATHGNIDAQCRMGHCYSLASGVKKDYQESIRWYTMAAEQDSIKAWRELAEIYGNIRTGMYDRKKAFQCWKKADELGDDSCSWQLAWRYERGVGTDIDEEKAFEYYQKAYEYFGKSDEKTSEYRLAMAGLANMYRYGKGVEMDREKAYSLYEQLANEGDVNAMKMAADMHRLKEIEKVDIYQVYKWYADAAKNGSKEAINFMVKVTRYIKEDMEKGDKTYGKLSFDEEYTLTAEENGKKIVIKDIGKTELLCRLQDAFDRIERESGANY